MSYHKAFIGFSKSPKIFGRLISFFQRGKYSHAFIAFEHNGKWVVVDSTIKGIKIHLEENFAKHHVIVRRYYLESSYEKSSAILKMAVEKSFHKYPIAEIIGNFFQLILKPFGIKLKNIFGLGENYPRCHELVAIILRDIYEWKIDDNLDSTDLIWLEEKVVNGKSN